MEGLHADSYIDGYIRRKAYLQRDESQLVCSIDIAIASLL